MEFRVSYPQSIGQTPTIPQRTTCSGVERRLSTLPQLADICNDAPMALHVGIHGRHVTRFIH
jgi:hypothetical protein